MKKLFSILLVLVMIFSVTALAAEPEHICAGKCDHEHEETAMEPRWQCSSHNLAPYNDMEYQQFSSDYHRCRTVSGDYCTNAGCDYKWVSYGNWYLESHSFPGGIGECVYCYYVKTK